MAKMLNELSQSDRLLIESLNYDPNLKPEFDIMRSHLVWGDELPLDISSTGLELLQNLWIARAIKHHGFKIGEPFDPKHFLAYWDLALEQNLKWPGFKRLYLCDRDKAYYDKCLADLNNDDDY